jgi:glycosyltransferase involved in cell wall biosynthesis
VFVSLVPVQVWVELPDVLDVDAHGLANARDTIPDRTPYGLHHLADRSDVQVVFRRPLHGRAATMARKVRNHVDSHEVVHGVLSARGRARRDADVVLCMDERTSLPAALLPGGPPLVSNLIWIRRPETYGRARREVTRRALHRMAGVFAQAHSLVDELREAWDLDPDRVHFVRLGVDPDFFGAQPWTEGSLTVSSVGDDPYRDHPTLIEAVRLLRAEGTDARLELGTTLPDVDMPEEMGALHRRRMEGAVRGMYRRSGVVALAAQPSNRGTGSTVVLEAAASARPVVATRNPAMEDLVGTDGSRGLLVPPGDPQAFADALASLLADPPRAQAMGAAARTWLEENHTTAHMAADIRAVLDHTVARSGSARRAPRASAH